MARAEKKRQALTRKQIKRALDICKDKPVVCPYYVGRQYSPNILEHWHRLLRKAGYSYDEALRLARFVHSAGLYFERALEELKESASA